MEKAIGMCVQDEDRLKKQNDGSLNFVHNKKKAFPCWFLLTVKRQSSYATSASAAAPTSKQR